MATTTTDERFRDEAVVLEHRARFGEWHDRAMALAEQMWTADRHDRIEPAVAVSAGTQHPWRYTAYYTRELPGVIEAFVRAAVEVRATSGARLDPSLIQGFLDTKDLMPALQNVAIGVDVRRATGDSRLKLGLGGQDPLPAATVAYLVDHSPSAVAATLDAWPGLEAHLWGANFDLMLDGRADTKLYFGFSADDADHPFLRAVVGDFPWARDGSVAFVQWARGEWVFHFNCPESRVAQLAADSVPLVRGSDRATYMLGCRAKDLARRRTATHYNLYYFYRRGEVPPRAPLRTRAPVGRAAGAAIPAGEELRHVTR